MATVSQPKLMTATDFMEADLGDGTFELIQGEIVEMPPPRPEHGVVCANVSGVLWDYGRRSKHGYTLSNDAGVLTSAVPTRSEGRMSASTATPAGR